VHLGAQLPLSVRGIFYDGWRIAGKPSDERQPVEFATLVAADLSPSLARDEFLLQQAEYSSRHSQRHDRRKDLRT
jgi:hypothetical protein